MLIVVVLVLRSVGLTLVATWTVGARLLHLRGLRRERRRRICVCTTACALDAIAVLLRHGDRRNERVLKERGDGVSVSKWWWWRRRRRKWAGDKRIFSRWDAALMLLWADRQTAYYSSVHDLNQLRPLPLQAVDCEKSETKREEEKKNARRGICAFSCINRARVRKRVSDQFRGLQHCEIPDTNKCTHVPMLLSVRNLPPHQVSACVAFPAIEPSYILNSYSKFHNQPLNLLLPAEVNAAVCNRLTVRHEVCLPNPYPIAVTIFYVVPTQQSCSFEKMQVDTPYSNDFCSLPTSICLLVHLTIISQARKAPLPR